MTMELNSLLDKAKEITGSDYKTASLMGLKGQHVSNWRKGRCKPNAESRAMLAAILKMDISDINVAIDANKKDKERMQEFLKKFENLAASVIICSALSLAAIQQFSSVYIM
jgi:transcriptional regulator with XRE-family HTH domain